jgi:F0F1-type ATP synthase epsilon subunit
MTTMTLAIITPHSQSTHTVTWVEAETLTGNLVLLPSHAPSYIILKKNSVLRWQLATGVEEELTIPDGILEVDRTKVLVLYDGASP